MILIIDHYDSFIDMICDYVASIGYKYELIKTDDIKLSTVDVAQYSHIIIGPGPGHPNDISLKETYNIISKSINYQIPLLGICLGHQMIGAYFGARICTASTICHGVVDELITTNKNKIFKNLPNQFKVTRYHSLIIDSNSLNDQFELLVIGKTLADEVMAIRHHELEIYGIQFHPESIMTEHGHNILENFLE
ncbi:MAG: aminodeoxychorismate/anthranilate synthase component II [Burkholderiales bacterium]|nr:aminodeoxychorismate/anthranilate synthase component II [Burkholderiales bacterium]